MSPRVASLVPAATELVWAVGALEELVGVSHACDYPEEVLGLPVLTRPRLAAELGEREIDEAVRELAEREEELYEVDVEALRRAAPEVVLAQELCEVCAVSPAAAEAALAEAGLGARVVALRAESLAGVARDAIEVGEALGRAEAGHALARGFEMRLAEIHRRTESLARPRVASLEWLDPPFAAGHWVPQMVRLAGGEEVLGEEAKASRRVEWSDVEAADPDLVCILPCGYDLTQCRRSWQAARAQLAAAGSPLSRIEAVLLDAGALFSRPGPRLVRGVEVLAALFHPAGFPVPLPHEGERA